MLEQINPEPLHPSSSLVDKPNRDDSKPETAKETTYRVFSIRQMMELFNKRVPVVFAGGQMYTRNSAGERVMVDDRVKLEKFCEENQIHYYDPAESKPENPTFEIFRDTDKMGILLSKIDVLSIGQETVAGVSAMEALFDAYLDAKPGLVCKRILYFPDAIDKDRIQFAPPGFMYREDDNALVQSIDFATTPNEVINSIVEKQSPDKPPTVIDVANLIRCELLGFVEDSGMLCTSEENRAGLVKAKTPEEFQQLKQNAEYSCYEITSQNLHLYDLVKCFSEVLDGKKVAIYFHPPVDQSNMPVMDNINLKDEEVRRKIVKQYINGGNSIRQLLIEKLGEDKNTTWVYSGEDLEQAVLKSYQEIDQPDQTGTHPQQADLLQ